MGSTVKLANDLYLETSSIVHNGELLSDVLSKFVRFKQFEISFDVSNKSVGDWVEGHTKNNVPAISGMQVVGFLVYYIGYGDKNFVLVPHWRANKVYTKMLLGYKGNETELNLSGYIIYAKPSIVDDTILT